MYISIEGIKGTGKSTLLKKVMEEPTVVKEGVELFGFTKPVNAIHEMERAIFLKPDLKQDDAFLELLFKERAYLNQSLIDTNADLIIGDRSILTAYVSRWDKWKDPFYTIRRVNNQYSGIIKPGVIIWLDAKPQMALTNIGTRPQKLIRVQDECHTNLIRSREIYSELLSERLLNKKIFQSQVIRLSLNENESDLTKEILQILKYYKSK